MNSTSSSHETLYHELIQCRNTINNILYTEFNYQDNSTANANPLYYYPPPYYPYTPYSMPNTYHPYAHNYYPMPRNSQIPIHIPNHGRNNYPFVNSTRNQRNNRNLRNTNYLNSRNSINSLINILNSLNNLQSRYRNNNPRNSDSPRDTNQTSATHNHDINFTNTGDVNNTTENSNNINHENLQNQDVNNNTSQNQTSNFNYNFVPQFNSLLNTRNQNYQNIDSVTDTSPIYDNTHVWTDINIDTSPQRTGAEQRFRDRIRQVLPELVEITLYSDGRPVNTDSMVDVVVPTNLNILRQNTEVSTFASLNASENSCCICQENFQDTDIVRKINSCGHVFHLNCLDTWLESHTSCPVCRHDIRDIRETTAVNENENESDNIEMID